MFNIASNGGASSSIFEFKDHVHLWPEVSYIKQLELTSRRLDVLLEERGVKPGYYDAAVLDVQGAELLVLKRAGYHLSKMNFVCCEAADFEAYAGACDLKTLSAFMQENGFVIQGIELFHQAQGVGEYYNVLYKKIKETNLNKSL